MHVNIFCIHLVCHVCQQNSIDNKARAKIYRQSDMLTAEPNVNSIKIFAFILSMDRRQYDS